MNTNNNNRTFKQNTIRSLKFLGIIAGSLFLLFVVLIVVVGVTHPVPATHAQPTQGRAQSEAPTTAPTAHATLKPVIVPTARPTATAVPTQAPVPTPKPTVDIATLPAYQLAAIDGADFNDPAVIARYQTVLDSLHNKTGSSEADIASMTLAGQGILTKDGYTGSDNTMIGLMDAADISITKSEHIKYADDLGALITLMENGG